MRLWLWAGVLAVGLAGPAWADNLGQVTQACFVPHDDCTALVVGEIDGATQSILLQGYSFTDPDIAHALVAAHRRGVDVRAVLDKSQPRARGGKARYLARAGIPVLIEHMPGIAHNKIMIIDGQRVLTGSFNWTRSAQSRNAENLVVISGAQAVADYTANWREHAANSRPLRHRKRS